MNAITPNRQTLIEHLLVTYHEHLLQVAGLQPSTCQRWTFFARQFLNAKIKPKAAHLDLAALDWRNIGDFFQAQAKLHSPARLQAMGTGLRSFFRYLCFSGRHPQDLSNTIPRIADPGREDLAEYLSLAQLQQVLQTAAGRTVAERRQRAVLLCLARLGLRAAEVAQLNLDDVDWRGGLIRITRTKGRQERLLPLPHDLGQALARYLRHRPKEATCRRIFLCLRHAGPVGANTISALAVRALKQAAIGCARPGAHIFRHTVASHLVQKGASLKAVADWLGHRHLSTTQLYAKVNLPLLRTVVQPWPSPEVPS